MSCLNWRKYAASAEGHQKFIYHCTSNSKCLTNDFHDIHDSALQLLQHDHILYFSSFLNMKPNII